MEQRETLDAELADARRARSARCRRRWRSCAATIADDRGRDRRRDRARDRAARDGLAKPIAESLLRDYERRRAQNRGAGAARLVGTTCQACHLTIPSTEAEQIRRVGRERGRVLRQLLRDPRAVTQDSLFEDPSRAARRATRRSRRLLRRRFAREPGPVGDRRGRARPVDRSAPPPRRRSASASGSRRTTSPSTGRSSPGSRPRRRSVRSVCACAPTRSSSSSR